MGIFDGKVAIITGGGKAKSIGYGIAVAYAKEGADLVLLESNYDPAMLEAGPYPYPLKRRIMDMGLTKGTEVYVRKVAPLGDPMELTVRGYELSVRKSDAENIEVE